MERSCLDKNPFIHYAVYMLSQYRTQVYLDFGRHEAVRKAASLGRVSVAEVIRRAIDNYIEHGKESVEVKRRKAFRDLMKLAGSIKGSVRDASVNHDKYIVESILGKKLSLK